VYRVRSGDSRVLDRVEDERLGRRAHRRAARPVWTRVLSGRVRARPRRTGERAIADTGRLVAVLDLDSDLVVSSGDWAGWAEWTAADVSGDAVEGVETVIAPMEWALRVDADAQGKNDGTTWADAFNDLQAAIAAATPAYEVWVAEGTYTPGHSREASFALRDGVEIYGGFAGWEATRQERAGSPVIDAGQNGALPSDAPDLDGDGVSGERSPWDRDGNPRVQGEIVDMGAYELQP